jgi:hypothetical protein
MALALHRRSFRILIRGWKLTGRLKDGVLVCLCLITIGHFVLITLNQFGHWKDVDDMRLRWVLDRLPSSLARVLDPQFTFSPSREPLAAAGIAVLFAALFVTLFHARRIFISYLGDLVVYLSAHKVNEYFFVREEIRRRCFELVRSIYESREEQGHRYASIIFVGHSLGSVIAFDTLNRILAFGMTENSGLNVEGRTEALLTLGSPLDQSAFLFKADDGHATLRTKLLARANPLIGNLSVRRRIAWINIYSRFDPISSRLRFFEPAGLGWA